MGIFDRFKKEDRKVIILDSMDNYYEECHRALENATSHDELLQAWHSFDFSNLTYEHREMLDQEFCKRRDMIRGYSQDLSSDWKLANFCHGGDLDED